VVTGLSVTAPVFLVPSLTLVSLFHAAQPGLALLALPGISGAGSCADGPRRASVQLLLPGPTAAPAHGVLATVLICWPFTVAAAAAAAVAVAGDGDSMSASDGGAGGAAASVGFVAEMTGLLWLLRAAAATICIAVSAACVLPDTVCMNLQPAAFQKRAFLTTPIAGSHRSKYHSVAKTL